MVSVNALVDISKFSLYLALFAILFNPAAWNIIARNEYRHKTITHLVGGNPRYGCYFLAVFVIVFGVVRDSLFHRALEEQPKRQILPEPYATFIPAIIFLAGQTFVITATWALGITGTFLGDYFGILMDHRADGFPFNVLRNPMYIGSTMCFAAAALWYESPVGLLITVYVYVVYLIALRFEGPFTDKMYSKRAKSSKKIS